MKMIICIFYFSVFVLDVGGMDIYKNKNKSFYIVMVVIL